MEGRVFKDYKEELASRGISIKDMYSLFILNKKFKMKVGMFTIHVNSNFVNLKLKDSLVKELTNLYINEIDNLKAKILNY